MRVLLVSTHGAGHFGPMTPLADAALAGGHEVLVMGPETLDPRGYPFRAGGSPPADVLRELWSTMHRRPPAQAEVVVVGTIFAGLNVQAMLGPLENAIADWKPDLVLRETSEYASAIAAERHGVPHARVGIMLAMVEEAGLAIATPSIEEVQPGIADAIHASPYLTAFPESFDPAEFPVVRFRDPAYDGDPKPLPDWWPGNDSPLVYVTFGSVAAAFASAADAYRAALAAVASLPVRVLLTVGRDIDLGETPPNVHVERWVPQADVLGHASLVVCHGGSGTTIGALAAGCPLVVSPMFADQPYNAWRVVDAGEIASLERLRGSVERVLEDDRYRAGAQAVAADMRRLPRPTAAILPFRSEEGR